MESVNGRLQLLKSVGKQQWSNLMDLVVNVIKGKHEEQLASLELFLETLNEPTYQVEVLWVMGFGFWVMGHGLWAMGYGLWVRG